MKKPELSEMRVSYTQDTDCCDSSLCQLLTIKTEDGGGGTFFVIETERWAFDDPQELIDLLTDFKRRFKNDCEKTIDKEVDQADEYNARGTKS